MNKCYEVKDSKVIVYDSVGHTKEMDYFDNIDIYLAEENLIERINEDINSIKRELSSKKYNNNKVYIPVYLLCVTGVLAICSCVIYAHGFPEGICSQEISTIFGNIKKGYFYAGLSYSFALSKGIGLTIDDYRDFKKEYKGSNKRKRGLLCKLSYLDTKLEFEKERLAILKREAQICNYQYTIFDTIYVDDSRLMYELFRMENLFYSLGYNYKELQKYYKSDTLEKHLPYNKYSEEEIDIIKGYFASRR